MSKSVEKPELTDMDRAEMQSHYPYMDIKLITPPDRFVGFHEVNRDFYCNTSNLLNYQLSKMLLCLKKSNISLKIILKT